MRKRVFFLDVIRTFAIFLVIEFHYNINMAGHGYLPAFIDEPLAWLNGRGVLVQSMFIALSGAALMLVYGKRADKIDLKDYARKRFLSIYPLFWVTYLVAFAFLSFWKGRLLYDTPQSRWLYTITAFDGWLLPVQETFYLLGEWFLGFIIIMYILFPMLLWLYRKHAGLLMGLAFAAMFIPWFWEPARLGMSLYISPLMRLFEFCFGMWFIMRYQDGPPLWQALLATVIFILVQESKLSFAPPLQNVTMGLCLFIVVAWLARFLERSDRVRRFFLWTSLYSYGAFLIHHVFQQFVLPRWGMPVESWLQFGVGMVFFVVLSWMMGYGLTKLTGVLVRGVLHVTPSRARSRVTD